MDSIQEAGLSKRETTNELRVIDQIIDKYDEDKSALIQILIDIQDKFSWVSKTAIVRVSERLEIPISLIYQTATFYKFFKLVPRGRHLVRICLGTACHIREGPKVMEAVERALGVEYGDVTSNGKFSLERVNCLGCCALGPVMVVDKDYYGNVKPMDIGKILAKYD